MLQFWQRKCSTYTFNWHSYHISRKEELRKEFYGTLLPNPVTGKPQLYYPSWKRRCRYLLSLLITIPMLLLGVLAMVLSLNLNGYIKDKSSPIYVSFLAQFAEPVRIACLCMYGNFIVRHLMCTVQISYNLNAFCVLRVPKNAFKRTITAANAYECNSCS